MTITEKRMTNEILTQEEFDQAFNGMGYDRLGTCEMQIKGSYAALLARVQELGSRTTMDSGVRLFSERRPLFENELPLKTSDSQSTR